MSSIPFLVSPQRWSRVTAVGAAGAAGIGLGAATEFVAGVLRRSTATGGGRAPVGTGTSAGYAPELASAACAPEWSGSACRPYAEVWPELTAVAPPSSVQPGAWGSFGVVMRIRRMPPAADHSTKWTVAIDEPTEAPTTSTGGTAPSSMSCWSAKRSHWPPLP